MDTMVRARAVRVGATLAVALPAPMDTMVRARAVRVGATLAVALPAPSPYPLLWTRW